MILNYRKIKMFVQLLFLYVCILLQVNSSRIKDLLDGAGYERSLRPLFGKATLPVKVQILMATLGPINEQDMTFELSFYLREYWNDPRLVHNGTLDVTSSNDPTGILWIPDIYIVNVREVKYFHDFTRTVIQKNGDIFFSKKVSAKCICNMDLRRYPMDNQTCHLQMESYAFNKLEMKLKWSELQFLTVPEDEKLSLTGYQVTKVSKSHKEVKYGTTDADTFSNLILHFSVRRTSVYYAYKAFLPTLFLTIFNLGSYFIPDEAMPARVTLIITTFLANMLILQSISDNTVQVSYTTAMQLFLLVNVMFLMTSIVQYLILLNLKKRAIDKKKKSIEESKMKKNKIKNNKTTDANKNGTTDVLHFNDHFDTTECGTKNLENLEQSSTIRPTVAIQPKKEHKIHILDRIFRIVMPFCYILFCAVFFGYYSSG